jgi:hypothetical protein
MKTVFGHYLVALQLVINFKWRYFYKRISFQQSAAVEPSVATMFNQGDAAGTKIKKAAVIHCCFFYNPTIVLFLLCSIYSSLWLLCSRAIFYIYHFNFK